MFLLPFVTSMKGIMFLPAFVCLSFSISSMTHKDIYGFQWNFQNSLAIWYKKALIKLWGWSNTILDEYMTKIYKKGQVSVSIGFSYRPNRVRSIKVQAQAKVFSRVFFTCLFCVCWRIPNLIYWHWFVLVDDLIHNVVIKCICMTHIYSNLWT